MLVLQRYRGERPLELMLQLSSRLREFKLGFCRLQTLAATCLNGVDCPLVVGSI